MPGIALSETIEKHDQTASVLSYSAQMEMAGISGTIGRHTPLPESQSATTVVVSRPPIDHCSWFVDLSDAKLNALLALPLLQRAAQLDLHATTDPTAATVLTGRNYAKQTMRWHENDSDLPGVLAHSVPSATAEGPRPAPQPPTVLRLPPEMPCQVPGVTSAEGIALQFESVVVFELQTYSPMRLWTLEARKPHAKLMTQTTMFGRKTKAYLWLKCGQTTPLVDITLNVKQIETASKAWFSTSVGKDSNVFDQAVAACPVLT